MVHCALFTKFCRKHFTDSVNQTVVKILVSEVDKLNYGIPLIQVRGMEVQLL